MICPSSQAYQISVPVVRAFNLPKYVFNEWEFKNTFRQQTQIMKGSSFSRRLKDMSGT